MWEFVSECIATIGQQEKRNLCFQFRLQRSEMKKCNSAGVILHRQGFMHASLPLQALASGCNSIKLEMAREALAPTADMDLFTSSMVSAKDLWLSFDAEADGQRNDSPIKTRCQTNKPLLEGQTANRLLHTEAGGYLCLPSYTVG
jgi:hypothetical protein